MWTPGCSASRTVVKPGGEVDITPQNRSSAAVPSTALIWACLEQAVAAANPFAVALAAVWLLPVAEHGRLALMAAGLAAGLAVHTALVLDPLTARGRVRPATLGAALGLWVIVSGVAGVVAAGASGLGPLAAAGALGFAAAAGPGLLALARRAAHLRRHASEAAAATALSVPPTLFLATQATSAEGFLAALAGGAGLAGAVMLGRSVRWPGRRVVRAAWSHHGRFGGWLLISAVPWVVATQAPLLVLAVAQGEAAAGALRALLLLALPVAHLSAAIGTAVQPRLASAARLADTRRSAFGWGGLIALLAAPWSVLLAAAPDAMIDALLGAEYLHAAPVLPVIALSAIVGAWGAGPAMALRAVRRGRAVAVASAIGGGVALVCAVALAPRHGVAGAAIALLAGRVSDIAVQTLALCAAPHRREVLAC